MDACGDESEDTENYFDRRELEEEFTMRTNAAMVMALQDLDGEGFFGISDERWRKTLLCRMDAYDDWFAAASSKYLNPPETFQTFVNEWNAAGESPIDPTASAYQSC